MVVIYQGEPHRVLDFHHRTPGKGAAFVRALLRNLKSGASYEIRFASSDSIERAVLDQREMQFLYHDETLFHFMDTGTFEQIALNGEDLGDYRGYLKEGQNLQIEFFEGAPIGVEMPSAVELKVVDTEPELKGATASNSPKPATLETGPVIQVPPFIQKGDVIRVDPNEGKYLERA